MSKFKSTENVYKINCDLKISKILKENKDLLTKLDAQKCFYENVLEQRKDLETKLNARKCFCENMMEQNENKPIFNNENHDFLNNQYLQKYNEYQEHNRIQNLKNLIFRESNFTENKNLLKIRKEDPMIGFNKSTGVNFGRPLFLGPKNGIYFFNKNLNPSYIPQHLKHRDVDWFV